MNFHIIFYDEKVLRKADVSGKLEGSGRGSRQCGNRRDGAVSETGGRA